MGDNRISMERTKAFEPSPSGDDEKRAQVLNTCREMITAHWPEAGILIVFEANAHVSLTSNMPPMYMGKLAMTVAVQAAMRANDEESDASSKN